MSKPWDAQRVTAKPPIREGATWQDAGPKVEFLGTSCGGDKANLRLGGDSNAPLGFTKRGLQLAAEFFNELAEQMGEA